MTDSDCAELLRVAALFRQAAPPTGTLESSEDWGSFTGRPPQIQLEADGRTATLLAPVSFTRPDGTAWPVPAGAWLDGASIPQPFWSLVGGPFEGKYRDGSIVHDHYCIRQAHRWHDTHRMFYEAMRSTGTPAHQAKILYYAVYRFGPRWPEPAGAEAVAGTGQSAPFEARTFAADAEAIFNHDLDLHEIETLADWRAQSISGAEAVGGAQPPEGAAELVIPGGRGTVDDVAAVAAAAAELPPFVAQRFRNSGIRIVACRESVTDFEVSLRGVVPRGWEGLGKTWDDVPGVYLDAKRRVVIATMDDGGARAVPTKASHRHGSSSLVLHESLHGYDYSGGHAVLRNPSFQNARTADYAKLDVYEKQDGQAGLEETFAESGARFIAEPQQLQGDWSHLFAYWNSGVPTTEVVDQPAEEAAEEIAPVGTARLRSDGRVEMALRATGPGGLIGHATFTLAPGDAAHERIVNVVSQEGVAEPGEEVLIMPLAPILHQ